MTLQGHEYRVGDCAYFDPDSFTFSVKLPSAAKKGKQDQAEPKPVHTVFYSLREAFVFFIIFFLLFRFVTMHTGKAAYCFSEGQVSVPGH